MIVQGSHAILEHSQDARRSSNCPSTSSMTSIGQNPSGSVQQQSMPAWQMGGSSSQSPARKNIHCQNFSFDSNTYREMLERRKSFRNRGSLVSVQFWHFSMAQIIKFNIHFLLFLLFSFRIKNDSIFRVQQWHQHLLLNKKIIEHLDHLLAQLKMAKVLILVVDKRDMLILLTKQMV